MYRNIRQRKSLRARTLCVECFAFFASFLQNICFLSPYFLLNMLTCIASNPEQTVSPAVFSCATYFPTPGGSIFMCFGPNYIFFAPVWSSQIWPLIRAFPPQSGREVCLQRPHWRASSFSGRGLTNHFCSRFPKRSLLGLRGGPTGREVLLPRLSPICRLPFIELRCQCIFCNSHIFPRHHHNGFDFGFVCHHLKLRVRMWGVCC